MRRLVVLVSLLALAGCKWLQSSGEDTLPGERIPVLAQADAMQPDTQLATIPVRLPRPHQNRDATHAGITPDHAPGHLALPADIALAWDRSVGTGRSDDAPIMAPPVVVDGVVYVMDAKARVSALDARTGDRYWRIDLSDDVARGPFISGGLAYADGKVFAGTGFAMLYGLDARTGSIVWRKRLSGPLRAPPTVVDGRVYQVTIDNRLHALAADSGERLWDHSGIEEMSGILGDAAPAVAADVVVPAYSSGEVYAIRQVNGRSLWSDTVAAISQADPLATIADISGFPVIDRDMIFVVSHSGRMAALSLTTGRRLWENSIGGVTTPWVAGDFVYVITNNKQLVCLFRQSGTVKWITQLREYVDLEDKDEPVVWEGPVLAGDRLIVVSSTGFIGAVSPYTGKFLGMIEAGAPISAPPVVAGSTLYVLTDDARLLAYR